MSEVTAEDPKEWIRRSEYDIGTAEAMLKAGRYLYVAFCCQQAIEKRLKAFIVKDSGKMPPRIHDLMRLVRQVGVEPSQEQLEELEILNNYYIESRYPEELTRLSAGLDKAFASRRLKIAKEFLLWLVRRKNSKTS